jgi:hypothetical protein
MQANLGPLWGDIEMMDAKEESFLRKVHPYAGVAAAMLEAFAEYPGHWLNEDSIVQVSRLPNTMRRSVLVVLSILVELGILRSNAGSWTGLEEPKALRRYSLMAEGLSVYLEKIHEDKNTVEVVVTKPRQPSVFDHYLPEFGRTHLAIETTEEAFFKIAASAKTRLVLLSPFIDDAGLAWVIELFSKTKTSVERVLIIREPEPLKHALMDPEIEKSFRSLNIRVLRFKVDKPENAAKYETFHAKTLLADRDYFYVGSFNLTAPSLKYSMEMGVAIKGFAAVPVAQIIDTIISISSEI